MSGLGRLVFTPSGPSMSIPLIGRVTLGPPTTFTVRPQPGQLLADFEAAAPRIAAAMGVAGIRVRPLAAEWIVIELIHSPADAAQPSRPARDHPVPDPPGRAGRAARPDRHAARRRPAAT